MDDLMSAVILGIVEGLTEFLPISSTGHLILTGHLLKFEGERAETFEVVIQLGAILAIVVLYWNRWLSMAGFGNRSQHGGSAGANGAGPPSAAASGRTPDLPAGSQRAPLNAARAGRGRAEGAAGLNLKHVVIAALPGAVVGIVGHEWIKTYMWNPYTVLFGLVAGGVFMIYAERKRVTVRARSMDEITYRQSFLIGLSQCLSIVIPGFSRSGATIAGGLLAGASVRAAADFSFMVAVPMMFGASGFDLLRSMDHLRLGDIPVFAAGFCTSFAVAMLAVVTFLKLLGKVKLSSFAYYRFALAAVFLVFLQVTRM